ncbi:ADP-ribosylation factor-like protein 4A, partial [Fragariocoptes setiger]
MGGAVTKNLPSLNTTHVVMLGLDCSGKTTVLYRLKFGQYLNTVPTIGFNCEKVRITTSKSGGINFSIWDVGGQDKLRPLWRSYTRCTDGIVFVVDSVEEERLEEAKMELLKIVKAPENKNVPILVLANKQDLPGAKEAKEIATLLGLTDLSPTHPWHVQPTCAVIGDGLVEGLEILYDMIVKRKRTFK